MAFRFHVLGPIEVRRDGEVLRLGGAQQRRMLAALLIEPGRVLPLARLEEVVWPDGVAPDGARRTLMSYVSRLRTVLGDDVIFNSGAGYRLQLCSSSLDSALFEEGLTPARNAAPADQLARVGALDSDWRRPSSC